MCLLLEPIEPPIAALSLQSIASKVISFVGVSMRAQTCYRSVSCCCCRCCGQCLSPGGYRSVHPLPTANRLQTLQTELHYCSRIQLSRCAQLQMSCRRRFCSVCRLPLPISRGQIEFHRLAKRTTAVIVAQLCALVCFAICLPLSACFCCSGTANHFQCLLLAACPLRGGNLSF